MHTVLLRDFQMDDRSDGQVQQHYKANYNSIMVWYDHTPSRV